jgi:glutamate 5-kinase
MVGTSGALISARKIVIKIGSNSLALPNGAINPAKIDHYTKQIATLISEGKRIVLVSSGASAAGTSVIGSLARKTDINYRQALCSIGQVELMYQWRQHFANHGLNIGQLLFTREDFLESRRNLNMRNTLFTLIDEGVVPVVNENDSVSYDEIAIGDNDNLSADTAILWNADLLVLLTDVQGVFDSDPKVNKSAKMIEEVSDVEELSKRITVGKPNLFGTGGLTTKLEAAAKVMRYGIEVILTDDLENSGTLFRAR